jgi:hypothetical protein
MSSGTISDIPSFSKIWYSMCSNYSLTKGVAYGAEDCRD